MARSAGIAGSRVFATARAGPPRRNATLSNRAPPMRLDLSDRQRETVGVALTILAACVILAAVGFAFWLLETFPALGRIG